MPSMRGRNPPVLQPGYAGLFFIGRVIAAELIDGLVRPTIRIFTFLPLQIGDRRPVDPYYFAIVPGGYERHFAMPAGMLREQLAAMAWAKGDMGGTLIGARFCLHAREATLEECTPELLEEYTEAVDAASQG